MNFKLLLRVTTLAIFSVPALACLGTVSDTGTQDVGNNGGDGGAGYSMSIGLFCDPDASVLDDLVIFVAEVEPQPDEVIAFWYGSTRVDLEYDAPNDQWEAAIWADDLDTDCDEVATAWSDFAAYDEGEEVADGDTTMQML